jgi:hypothetical protein
MAKKGKKFIFRGAYRKKSDAVEEERKHPGSFIVKRKIRGKTRELVLTRRKR